MRNTSEFLSSIRPKTIALIEAQTTSDRAHELGYEYQSRGVWMDPKDGKKYKEQGSRFVPIDEPAKKDPKSMDQYKSDVEKATTPGPEVGALQGKKSDTSDVLSDEDKIEMIARGLSGGRWDKIDARRREDLYKAARTQVAAANQRAAMAAAAQEPVQEPAQEPDPKPKEEPKVDSEKDPGSMAQRMANDAEYEAQIEKDGEEALLDIQTEPNETPAPKPKPKAKKVKDEEDEVPADLKAAGDDFLKSLLSGSEKKVDKSVAKAKKKKTFTNFRKEVSPNSKVDSKVTEERLKAVIDNVNPNGVGSKFTSDRGRVSAKTAVLSGLNSPEDFPEFQSKELKGITNIVRDYIEKENSMYFYDTVASASGSGDFKMDGSDYLHDAEANNINTELKTIDDVNEFLKWSEKGGNKKYGKQLNPYPQEREALINNYKTEESTSIENLIKKSTVNPNISDEMVEQVWKTLPKPMKNRFNKGGHGIGGSHPYWKDHEEEWGKGLLKRYLMQGGYDGYLRTPESPPLSITDMAADHVIAYSEKPDYWKDKALETNPDLKGSDLVDAAKRLADDPSNIIFTRWGFNQQQKDKNALWDVRERYRREAAKGSSKLQDKNKDSQDKKRRGELRNSEYWQPLMDEMKSIVSSGKLTQEGYDEIKSYSQAGYEMLGKSGYGRDLSKSPGFYQRNAMTDPYRALLEQVNLGRGLGINIFGGDRLRGGDGQQKSGWQGIDGKHSNTSADGNIDQSAMIDPGTDYIKDPLAQLYFFGGSSGRGIAQESMKRIKRAGDALVTGEIGSGDFVNYLRENLNITEEILKENGTNFQSDMGAADEHLRILNSAILKNILKEKKPSATRLQENIQPPERSAMRANLNNTSMMDEFARLNSDLKARRNPEEWDEIYKDTIFESEELDGDTI